MTLEPRRIEIFTGHSLEDWKLKNQLDLILPSNESFEYTLETSLKAPQYLKGKISLCKLISQSANFIQKYATQSGFSLLSAGSGPTFSTQEEDVWCIDYRGVLTLSVCKDTYEALGLPGKRVAFGKGKAKQGDGRHVISIPLYTQDTVSTKIRAQREAALRRWEERRGREVGTPLWNVLVFSESIEDLETFPTIFQDQSFETVRGRCQKNVLNNVHVPVLRLNARPKAQEEEDDWYEAMEGLFEWVGMAGLGAARIKANDRIDPFVAVYELPSLTRIGNIVHLRWTGFIGPSFVQSLLEILSTQLSETSTPETEGPDFISLISHACTWAPVSYISRKAQASGGTNVTPPLRDPTREVEDSWCLITTSSDGQAEAEGNDKTCIWALAESVGKHDTRLG